VWTIKDLKLADATGASKKQVTRAARHKQFNEGRKDL
jgi:hypothetical protein